MATTKSAGSKAGSRSKQAKSSSSNGSRATTKAKPTGSTRAKSSGSTRAKSTGSPRAKSTGSARAKTTASPRAKATGSQNGAGEATPSTLRRARGPAIAAGTAAAAIAGGLVLKSRLGRKRILGVPVPRSVTNGGLSSVDLQALAKTVGKASRQVGETSKGISKDIERIGDRAERFGKLLS